MKGHFDKADVAPKKTPAGVPAATTATRINVGDIVKADTFAAGDRVDVVGTSKGKGYAGAIKRWNFHSPEGNPRYRPGCTATPVPTAPSSDPSRVFKGKKLPGHHGRRARHRPEPRRRQGRCGEQPDRHQGRDSRPQGRHRRASPTASRRRKGRRKSQCQRLHVLRYDRQAGRRDGAVRRRLRHRAQRARSCTRSW